LIDLLSTADKENIAIVGHQPDLSIHIYNLCGKASFNLSISPGTIAKIEFNKVVKYGAGRLIFLIPPSVNK